LQVRTVYHLRVLSEQDIKELGLPPVVARYILRIQAGGDQRARRALILKLIYRVRLHVHFYWLGRYTTALANHLTEALLQRWLHI
jgi:hypothetical protein